jgi:hypothetical protein
VRFRGFRVEHLRHVGWEAYRAESYVNWCGTRRRSSRGRGRTAWWRSCRCWGRLVDSGIARATVHVMPDAEKKKKEYLELLAKTPAQAHHLEKISREIIQNARLAEDVTTPISEIIANLPADKLSPEEWDRLIAGQRMWVENAARLERSMANTARIFAAGSSVMSTTGASVVYGVTVYGLPQGAKTKIQGAKKELDRVFEQAPVVESTRVSMRRLGLDRRVGAGDRKCARELLDEAKTALDRPSGAVGGEVAVLLTLRAAIEAALSELIRRRPVQEPASNNREKIRSIGRHCALAGAEDQFEALASPGHELINTLSGMKEAALPRTELINLFQRGVLLLDGLLKNVDETKLRQ